MGCFLGCFGSSVDRKRKKQRYKVIPRDQKPRIQDILKVDASLDQSIRDIPSHPISESREKTEVSLSLKRRKKVTFDTNVTTYEPIQVYDSTESLLEKNEKGETFPKSEPNSVVSSIPNYRYGNCVESDDDIEDLEHEDYDFDDDDDGYGYDLEDEEHYDDNVNDIDHGEVSVPSMELNRSTRDRNGYVPSVLNPVENLSQWKALKSNGSTRKPLTFNGQKENLNSRESNDHNQETAVNASLSNWLVSAEKITRNNNTVFPSFIKGWKRKDLPPLPFSPIPSKLEGLKITLKSSLLSLSFPPFPSYKKLWNTFFPHFLPNPFSSIL